MTGQQVMKKFWGVLWIRLNEGGKMHKLGAKRFFLIAVLLALLVAALSAAVALPGTALGVDPASL